MEWLMFAVIIALYWIAYRRLEDLAGWKGIVWGFVLVLTTNIQHLVNELF